jgi:hypothetical protein
MYTALDWRSHVQPSLQNFERFLSPGIHDAVVRTAIPLTRSDGRIIFDGSGGNAFIVKMKLGDDMPAALRILKRFPVEPAWAERLASMTAVLDGMSTSVLTGYRFFNPGILIHADDEIAAIDANLSTPFLLMDWVEGPSLGVHLRELCAADDRAGIRALFEKWIELAREMNRKQFAHGDITASNVMVRSSDGALVLVDYDDLWLPDLPHPTGIVPGTPGYQHPKEAGRRYALSMDTFSILVMAATLAVLAEDPQLFRNVDQPLFTAKELTDIDSVSYVRARAVGDPRARAFVDLLDRARLYGSASVQSDFEALLFPVGTTASAQPVAVDPIVAQEDSREWEVVREPAQPAAVVQIVADPVAEKPNKKRSSKPAAVVALIAGLFLLALAWWQLRISVSEPAAPAVSAAEAPPTSMPALVPDGAETVAPCAVENPYGLSDGALQNLGCAAAPFVSQRNIRVQWFERGFMVLFDDAQNSGFALPDRRRRVYAFADDGRAWRLFYVDGPSETGWGSNSDEWYTCDRPSSGQNPVQSGVPWREFGRVWCENRPIAAALGSVRSEESELRASFQSYDRGRSFQIVGQQKAYTVFFDLNAESIEDTYLEGRWE